MSDWILILGLLIFQLTLTIYAYLWVGKRAKKMSLHQSMNFTMVAAGTFALGMGVLLIYEFPIRYMEITAISTVLGVLTGGLFGKLFGREVMLSGYVCGFMTGMMAPMLGAAASYSLSFTLMIEFFIVCSILLCMKELKLTEEKASNVQQ